MTSWLDVDPFLTVLASIAVLLLPGLAVGLALRLRGLALWALAPVLSVALLGVLAIVFGWLGIAWAPGNAAIGSVVVLAIAVGVGVATRRAGSSPREGSPYAWLTLGGLVIGASVGAARVLAYIPDPLSISQTNDAVFHVNALRYILETGSASSLDVSGVLGATSFYPAAWHGVASLVQQLAGADTGVATNAVSLVIAAAVWPLGIAWFTKVISPWGTSPAFAAAISPLLLTFPMLPLQWGVLYPYALAVALLPSGVAAVMVTLRGLAATGLRPAVDLVRWLVVSLAATGAIALAQPAALLAGALLITSWATWRLAAWIRRGGAMRARAIAATIVVWVGFVGLWFVLTRSIFSVHWAPFRRIVEAAGDVVLNAQMWLPPAVLASVLCVVGLVAAVRLARLRWLACAWAGFGVLYIAAAALGSPILRHWLVGAWYGDPYRLAALAPVVVVPLAAIGVSAMVGWIVARGSKAWTVAVAPFGLAMIALAGIVGMLLAPVVNVWRVFEDERDTASRYVAEGDSFLSPDERSLLERLDTLVPSGERVVANPSSGAAFGYGLSGVDVYPRTWQQPATPEWAVLAQRLHDVAGDPTVCAALADVGSPEYVLDFGVGEAAPGRWVMPGMTDFADHSGFDLVDRQGEASLWRITACAR